MHRRLYFPHHHTALCLQTNLLSLPAWTRDLSNGIRRVKERCSRCKRNRCVIEKERIRQDEDALTPLPATTVEAPDCIAQNCRATEQRTRSTVLLSGPGEISSFSVTSAWWLSATWKIDYAANEKQRNVVEKRKNRKTRRSLCFLQSCVPDSLESRRYTSPVTVFNCCLDTRESLYQKTYVRK